MRLNVLCFVAGAWWLQQQAELPGSGWAWAIAACVAATAARPEGAALCFARETLIKVGCFALGFAWAAWCAQHRLADALPPEWEGRDIAVTGVVAGLPQAYDRGVRFEFDVERVLTAEARARRGASYCRGGAARRAMTGPPLSRYWSRASAGS